VYDKHEAAHPVRHNTRKLLSGNHEAGSAEAHSTATVYDKHEAAHPVSHNTRKLFSKNYSAGRVKAHSVATVYAKHEAAHPVSHNTRSMALVNIPEAYCVKIADCCMERGVWTL
jgi:hypothetical protein